MSLTVHRVSKLKYAQLGDLNEYGYGAAFYGSRWNTPDPDLRFNRRIVFASDTLALAMLEVIVHAESQVLRSVPHGHVLLSLDEGYLAELQPADLPSGWNATPDTAVTQVIGDQWYDEGVSAILRAPSAILPLEDYGPAHSNYLINAAHPDVEAAVKILTFRPLLFDPRL